MSLKQMDAGLYFNLFDCFANFAFSLGIYRISCLLAPQNSIYLIGTAMEY